MPADNHATDASKMVYQRKTNGIAEDLAGMIGFSNTLLLCGTRGGGSLYIPQTATPGHLLENLIGKSAFRRLVDEMGGTSFSLPTLAEFQRYQRIRKCADLIAAGKSLHQVSQWTGVTYQQAKNDRRAAEMLGILPKILKSPKKED